MHIQKGIFAAIGIGILARVFYTRIIPSHDLVLLLGGQSNMAGRGGLDKSKVLVVPPSYLSTNSKIQSLNPNDAWELAKEPLHKGIDTKRDVGIGPGLILSKLLLKDFSTIGLVPSAIGGSSIQDWYDHGHLQSMLRRAKVAKKGAKKMHLIWYQGESDAVHKQDAETYAIRLKVLLNEVRKDLDMPNLPITLVLITGETTER